MKQIFCGLWLLSATLVAADTQAVLDRVKEMRTDAALVQQRIDTLDEESRELYEEYRLLARELQAQQAYNAQLEQLIASQEREMASLDRQIVSVEETSRRVMPMMARMVESLEVFVALDLPFLPQERADRVERLQETLYRADATVAERYRVILEAYGVENEYGRTIETWRDELEDGRSVEFFRLGRIGLYYLTLDGRQGGRYNTQQKRYEPMTREQTRELARAIRMARQEAIPELIALPLDPPSKERL